MTPCNGTSADRYLERYVQGTLPEFEARRFEEHFFECPVCLAQVEALQAVALKLGGQSLKMPKAVVSWPVRGAALAAIAALLLVGFFALRTSRPPAQPIAAVASPALSQPANSAPSIANPPLTSAALSRLADLTLPPFRPAILRGESRDPHFDAGMKAFSRRDCPQALASLAQVPAQDENALAAHFYLGVCQMQQANLAAASKTLSAVAEAGDSPEQEAALYYLAQVAMLRNDATNARHDLARTIALHGDFEPRARIELNKIR
jgi:anti-sigma factor RsiW